MQVESLLETNTLENIKMINQTDKELTQRQMETNTSENLKMDYHTDRELGHMRMEELKKVFGKKAY